MANDPLALGQLYQQQSRRVLATLIRLFGDFTLAEEAMQEAFTAAIRQWPEEGTPDNPTAWLIRTGHRRGIDQLRRKQTARQYRSATRPGTASQGLRGCRSAPMADLAVHQTLSPAARARAACSFL